MIGAGPYLKGKGRGDVLQDALYVAFLVFVAAPVIVVRGLIKKLSKGEN
jgi:hypothetical protein